MDYVNVDKSGYVHDVGVVGHGKTHGCYAL